MSAPDLSVIICTLNEGAAIGGVVADVRRELAGVSHEVIVVDDDSADDTAAVAEAAGARVIVRRGQRGLASAAIAGWDAAGGRWLSLMDGDGQHDPALQRRMLAISDGCDLVVASRNIAGGALGLGPWRALVSRTGRGLSGLVLGAQVTDPMSGCFLMRREWYTAARPKLTGVGFKILVDLIASAPRARVAETPTTLRPREGGESKLDARVVLDLAALLIEKRSGGLVPVRFTLFALVGVSGVAIQSLALALGDAADLPFRAALAVAILVAMTWNYVLNNVLTFRDQRLRGVAFWRGLLTFALSCLGGAVVNWAVGSGLQGLGAPGQLAAVVGALLGGVWNFWAARRTTWTGAQSA